MRRASSRANAAKSTCVSTNSTCSTLRSKRERVGAKKRAPCPASYHVSAKKPTRSTSKMRMKNRYATRLARRDAHETAHLDAFAELLRRFVLYVFNGFMFVLYVGLFEKTVDVFWIH